MARVQIRNYARSIAGVETSDIRALVALGPTGVKAVLTALNNFVPDHENLHPLAKLPVRLRAQGAGIEIYSGAWVGDGPVVVTSPGLQWRCADLGITGRAIILANTFAGSADGTSTGAGGQNIYLYVNGVATGRHVEIHKPNVYTLEDGGNPLTTVGPDSLVEFRFVQAAGVNANPVHVYAQIAYAHGKRGLQV